MQITPTLIKFGFSGIELLEFDGLPFLDRHWMRKDTILTWPGLKTLKYFALQAPKPEIGGKYYI